MSLTDDEILRYAAIGQAVCAAVARGGLMLSLYGDEYDVDLHEGPGRRRHAAGPDLRLALLDALGVPAAKRCPGCRQDKPLDAYSVNADGRYTYCRVCEGRRQARRPRRLAAPE